MKWTRGLILSLCCFCFFSLSLFDTAKGVSPSPQWQTAADELIKLIESSDKQTQQDKLAWQEIKDAIKLASRNAETAAGFYVSVDKILSAWSSGRGLRLLNNSQASYYAYSQAAPEFREVGAWFAAKGAKWYVKQVSRRPGQVLRRGDAILKADFNPVLSWKPGSKETIEVQAQTLEAAKKVELKVQKKSLAAWALEETQMGSQTLPLGEKRLCEEKVWLWLTPPVALYLDSKLRAAQESCDAILVDLRDSFGEKLPSSTLKSQSKNKPKPLVVLVNRETREQAVNLALKLKDELGATIVGEATAPRLVPQQKLELKEMPWLLLIYEKSGGSLRPDVEIADPWMLTVGFDEVREAGIKQLKALL